MNNSLKDNYQFFKLSEFDQPGLKGSGKNMDYFFMHRMDNLRRAFGKPIIVTSGYRTPEYNNKISSSGLTGPHTTGRACDILVSGKDAFNIVRIAYDYGFTGIGIKQHGPHNKRFIHLDDLRDHETKGPRPWIWSYM